MKKVQKKPNKKVAVKKPNKAAAKPAKGAGKLVKTLKNVVNAAKSKMKTASGAAASSKAKSSSVSAKGSTASKGGASAGKTTAHSKSGGAPKAVSAKQTLAVPVAEKAPGKGATKAASKAAAKAAAAEVEAAMAVAAEVVLTNADGKEYCRAPDCDNEGTTSGYCRLHYIAYWRRNKNKIKILQDGKLGKYIDDLTSKYPDRFLEILRKDLLNEKEFALIIAEMDVEEENDEMDNQEEEASRFIEEVRGGVAIADDDGGDF